METQDKIIIHIKNRKQICIYLFVCHFIKWTFKSLCNGLVYFVGPRPWLLFANKFDVRKLQVGTWLLEPVVEDLSSAVSIAFYKDRYVYWSDVHMETISR